MREEEVLGKVYDLGLLNRLCPYVALHRGLVALSIVLPPILALLHVAQPVLIFKVGVDRYIAHGDLGGLRTTALILAAALLLEFGLTYVLYLALFITGQNVIADLRNDLFAHVQRLSSNYFDRNPVGRVMTRLTTDVEVIAEMFASGLVAMTGDVMRVLTIVVVMLVLSPELTLVSFAVLPVLVALVLLFRIGARRAFRRVRVLIARINVYLQEHLTGMEVVQAFVQEERCKREFAGINDEHRKANLLSIRYDAMLFAFVELLGTAAVGLLFWYGGGEVVRKAIEVGTLLTFVDLIQKFFIPVRDLSAKYTILQSGMAASERIFELLDVEPAVPPPAAPRTPETGAAAPAVEFDRVSFAYKRGEPVLEEVSFRIAPGEKVALVGATGAGKSTLAKLIGRSYDVREGAVRVAGLDVREWDLAALRRRIAVVPQDVFLFSGAIYENLTLFDDSIDPERVHAAAEAVHAAPFINRLPGGFEASVRERGSNLSGGQRQLISFCRALVKDAPLLILDEATSHVDPETEALIQDALAKLLEGRTALVIAHRLSTIRRSDRIFVMHRGRLREEGTHEELLARRGIYYRLYRLQYAENGRAAE